MNYTLIVCLFLWVGSPLVALRAQEAAETPAPAETSQAVAESSPAPETAAPAAPEAVPAPAAEPAMTNEPPATVAEAAPAAAPVESPAPVIPAAEGPSPAAAPAPVVSAETPAPAVAAAPAAAPVESPASVVPAVETPAPAAAPAPATPAEFELDRRLPAAPPPAKAPASFWRRLFGGRPAEASPVMPPAVVSEPVAPEAPAAPAKPLAPEDAVAQQEEIRRQEREIKALKFLDQGYQAMARNDFGVAISNFNEALAAMPSRPHTVETVQKARESQAECEYRMAANRYRAGDLPGAKEAVRRALEYDPTHAKVARLSAQIKKDEEQRAAAAARPVPVRLAPDRLDRQAQIQDHLVRGRQYYAIGDYDKARREFRAVQALDEKNPEASAHLERLANKMFQLETDQMQYSQAEMMTQVRDTWTPPLKKEITGPELRPTGPTIIERGKEKLIKKLNSLVIPQLEFRQANIVDVIRYLDQASQAVDKDSPPADKGVNFILNLGRQGGAGAAPAEAAEEQAAGASSIPTVTLSLRNILLIDAIKYITEVTGLKYRVEDNVVVVTSSDVVVGDLMTRTYRVQPSIADQIRSSAPAAAGDGKKFELGAAAPTSELGDVRQFFIDAGVPFPEGTSIVYRPSLNLLIVKNTAENLDSLERILNSLSDLPKQVEIEARFVEVSQQDLEELGVEWLLTDNWELAENASAGAPVPLAARERIQVNKNQMTKGLRHFAMGASGITATPGGSMAGILSISSVLTNPELSFIVHALEQKSGANLLSAPKVTTKSGQNAEIKVVKELIYPTEFELTPPVMQTGGGVAGTQLQQAFVTPSSFETRDTGVILNVTPTVGPDGWSIELVMMPQVVELSDWINYGSTIIDPVTGQPQVMNMPQPIFHSRNINTSITIWDGQTVVMGGLITEQQTTSDDKVPLLGDIPLLGYLFRSKTSNSKKFNLLIFVTANIVDPAGNKINKDLIATAVGTAAPAVTTAAAP